MYCFQTRRAFFYNMLFIKSTHNNKYNTTKTASHIHTYTNSTCASTQDVFKNLEPFYFFPFRIDLLGLLTEPFESTGRATFLGGFSGSAPGADEASFFGCTEAGSAGADDKTPLLMITLA
jgi:hypothetical protein